MRDSAQMNKKPKWDRSTTFLGRLKTCHLNILSLDGKALNKERYGIKCSELLKGKCLVFKESDEKTLGNKLLYL